MRTTWDKIRYTIRVGDEVMEVEGGWNDCIQCNTTRRTEVTEIEGDTIRLNGCSHALSKLSGELEYFQQEITWDNIKVGDEIKNSHNIYSVEATLGNLVACTFKRTCSGLSITGPNTYDIHWETKDKLQSRGFTIVQPEPPTPPTPPAPREVTMADVIAKFGENVVIKKDV